MVQAKDGDTVKVHYTGRLMMELSLTVLKIEIRCNSRWGQDRCWQILRATS